MKKATTLASMFILLLLNYANGQNLNMTFGNSPTQLVQSGLVGSGIVATNITGQTGTNSSATFINNGVTGFPFTTGLVLSTGSIININSASSVLMSSDQGMAGDPMLDILSSPAQTYDAQVLTFDFVASGDSVEFDFIFSSEEYNEFVNSGFNDIFGFFVTGPGYNPNTNVAIIPGTVTPVSINNVNNGGPYSGGAMGPCMNCAYYIDNVPTPNPISLAADGFTTAMNIRFQVQPCATYTFKIAIADVSDGIFDSQVFFQEGSFTPCSSPRISAGGVVQSFGSTYYLCYGDSIELSAPPGAVWSNAATTQTIYVNTAGTYSASYSNGTCFTFTSSLNIVVLDSIIAPTITLGNDTIFSGYNIPGYTFSWTLDGQPIPNPMGNQVLASQAGCYVMTVTDSIGCSRASNTVCITLTGIQEINSNSFNIKPNPVTSISTIETNFTPGTSSELIIFDISGRLISKKKVVGDRYIEFSKDNLREGLYFIEIINLETGSIIKGKVMVK